MSRGGAAKLVVFDLGRVLVRICDNWQHAFERAGVTLAPDAVDPATRERLLESVKRIEVGQGEVGAFCEEVAGHLGIPCADVTRMWQGYTIGVFDGAAQLIDDLRSAGVATACLSNTNAEHWRVLTDPADPQGELIQRLDHRFASHLVGARKPDPAIYNYVERQTGFVPSQMVFFDDLPENLPPAKERGWTTFLVERCDNPIPAIRKYLEGARVL